MYDKCKNISLPTTVSAQVKNLQVRTKKLVEKTWFLAIMEGIRCVTYSDDGTVLEMFFGLATMEN